MKNYASIKYLIEEIDIDEGRLIHQSASHAHKFVVTPNENVLFVYVGPYETHKQLVQAHALENVIAGGSCSLDREGVLHVYGNSKPYGALPREASYHIGVKIAQELRKHDIPVFGVVASRVSYSNIKDDLLEDLVKRGVLR